MVMEVLLKGNMLPNFQHHSFICLSVEVSKYVSNNAVGRTNPVTMGLLNITGKKYLSFGRFVSKELVSN